MLVATVFVAVNHAEVVALRVGEPFGSLILAVAVTVIEVGMIVILILEDPEAAHDLPRDTEFSALMITTTGIVGGSLLIKTIRRKVATFNADGVGGALVALAALSVLSLVFPSVTNTAPGPTFTNSLLTFAAVASLAMYGTFVAVQTVRHRDYFIPPIKPNANQSEITHATAPSHKVALLSFAALIVSSFSSGTREGNQSAD